MTENQKKIRNDLAQQNFEYFLWNGKHINDSCLLYILYNASFCKSEAEKAIIFIKNQTVKAIK